MTKRSRRAGVLIGALAGLAILAGCRAKPPRTFAQKLVILGFDGLDPALTQRWMDEGKLPNMARLAAQGRFAPLETSHSPESPTAWASFATGVNAGKHNIYDFLVRDTNTYVPDLGMVRREPPRFLFNYIPIAKPKIHSIRGGTSFWIPAGAAGVRSSILTVPVTFPPEHIPNGEMLSGLPLPDIRGTMGTFSYFASDLSRYEEGNTEFGGILRRLVFEGDTARAELAGPPNPLVRARQRALRSKPSLTENDRNELAELDAREDLSVPFTVRWDRASKRAAIDLGGRTMQLGEKQWSTWVPLDFRANLFIRIHGMAQLYLIAADKDLQLYVSPINWRPDAPPAPMSAPESFAADLHARLGLYRTLGWAEATWPLNEGRMDEQTFMDDLYRAFDDRANVILSRLATDEWDLLVGVIESTDRVQHMMWRLHDTGHPMYDAALARQFGDAIERVYRRCDQFVGEVLDHLDPKTPILIVSDHGFHSFRYAVNLNTWLVQEGFMTLQGQPPGEKKLDDLFGGGGQFWENVDWSRTRAYAMGLGQIYFNVRGRESKGIVNPANEYHRLADELSSRLLTMTDPQNGQRIVRAVYKRDDVYRGPFIQNASDLQVGLEEGYRVSWQTTLGGAPPGIVYPNMKKWSGDHGAYDYQTTAGVLITNQRLSTDLPRIIDIAPTVLKYFGLTISSDIDGKPLF